MPFLLLLLLAAAPAAAQTTCPTGTVFVPNAQPQSGNVQLPDFQGVCRRQASAPTGGQAPPVWRSVRPTPPPPRGSPADVLAGGCPWRGPGRGPAAAQPPMAGADRAADWRERTEPPADGVRQVALRLERRWLGLAVSQAKVIVPGAVPPAPPPRRR